MAGIQTTGPASPSTVTTQSKENFKITGATIGTTETTITIPIGTRAFRLHTKKGSNAVLTVSDVITGTASSTTSWDIGMGTVWQEENLIGTAALTVYIKSSKAATDVQLLYWL